MQEDGMSFFRKPGSIVTLQHPYKPSGMQWHHSDIAFKDWQGFTHGIIARESRHEMGRVATIELYLYDPVHQFLYVESPHGIPTYVEFHISELNPYKDVSASGYKTI